MEVKQSMVFDFVFYPGGRPFSFSIPAATQAEASQKLTESLRSIVKELTEVTNRPAKGNEA